MKRYIFTLAAAISLASSVFGQIPGLKEITFFPVLEQLIDSVDVCSEMTEGESTALFNLQNIFKQSEFIRNKLFLECVAHDALFFESIFPSRPIVNVVAVDAYTVVVVFRGGMVEVWNRDSNNSWKWLANLTGEDEQTFFCPPIAIVDSNTIVIGLSSGTSKVWSRNENGDWIFAADLAGEHAHTQRIFSVAGVDSNTIVIGLSNGTSKVWSRNEWGDWVWVADLAGDHRHKGRITAVIGLDSDTIITRSVRMGRTAKVWTRDVHGSWNWAVDLSWEERDMIDLFALDVPLARINDNAFITRPFCERAKIWFRNINGSWSCSANLCASSSRIVAMAAIDSCSVVTGSDDGTVALFVKKADGSWVLQNSIKLNGGAIKGITSVGTEPFIITFFGGTAVVLTIPTIEGYVLIRKLQQASFQGLESIELSSYWYKIYEGLISGKKTLVDLKIPWVYEKVIVNQDVFDHELLEDIIEE